MWYSFRTRFLVSQVKQEHHLAQPLLYHPSTLCSIQAGRCNHWGCLHPELETTRLLQGLFLFPLIVSVNFVMGICLFGVIDLVTSHCILKHMAQSLAHTIINTAKTSARGAVFISTMGTLQEAVSLLVSTILIGQSVRTSFLAVR